MKKIISIIAYIIIWYIALIYIPWLWNKIDDTIWLNINGTIFKTVDVWVEKLWTIKDYLNEFIDNLTFSFNSKWKAEDYIIEK